MLWLPPKKYLCEVIRYPSMLFLEVLWFWVLYLHLRYVLTIYFISYLFWFCHKMLDKNRG